MDRRSAASWLTKGTASVALLLVVLSVAAILFVVLSVRNFQPFPLSEQGLMERAVAQGVEPLKTQLNELSLRLDKMEIDMKGIEANLQGLSQVPDQAKVAAQLNRLDSSMSSVQTTVANLEKIILDNPSKALEMRLLHKDFESMKASYQADIQATQLQVGRVYDLFLYLMVPISLSILGLAATTILALFKKGA